jgi:hypothetical protein
MKMNYDSIKLSPDEYGMLVQRMSKMLRNPEARKEYVLYPALDYYQTIIYGNNSSVVLTVDLREEFRQKEPIEIPPSGIVFPVGLVVYRSDSDNETIKAILSQYENDMTFVFNPYENPLTEEEQNRISIFLTNAILIVQFFLYNRPEIFRYTIKGKKKKNRRDKSARKSANTGVAKTLRVITLNHTEFEKESAVRKSSLPSWGVIGHFRHYKNGKTIWIKPYRKGILRDKDDAYVGKQYLI